jgi:non-ribosomal peptide synthetase component F
MNLARFLMESAARRPEHPAVVFGDHVLTYADLVLYLPSLMANR